MLVQVHLVLNAVCLISTVTMTLKERQLFGARGGTGRPTRRHDNAVPHSCARLRRGPLVDIHSHRSALNLPSVVLAGGLLRFVVVVEGRPHEQSWATSS